jgi:hypothetical protein
MKNIIDHYQDILKPCSIHYIFQISHQILKKDNPTHNSQFYKRIKEEDYPEEFNIERNWEVSGLDSYIKKITLGSFLEISFFNSLCRFDSSMLETKQNLGIQDYEKRLQDDITGERTGLPLILDDSFTSNTNINNEQVLAHSIICKHPIETATRLFLDSRHSENLTLSLVEHPEELYFIYFINSINPDRIRIIQILDIPQNKEILIKEVGDWMRSIYSEFKTKVLVLNVNK